MALGALLALIEPSRSSQKRALRCRQVVRGFASSHTQPGANSAHDMPAQVDSSRLGQSAIDCCLLIELKYQIASERDSRVASCLGRGQL